MLPHAQLCDICSLQFASEQPDQGLHHIPEDLAPPALPSPDVRKQLAVVPDPLKEPALSASFATHLAAANSCLVFRKAGFTRAEELGCFIRTAGDNLAKSCVNC